MSRWRVWRAAVVRILPHATLVSLASIGLAAAVGVSQYVIGRIDLTESVFNDRYARYQDSLQDLKTRLDKLESSITYRWTARDMRYFVNQFKAMHPDLEMPDVDQVMQARVTVPLDVGKTP